MGVFTPKKKDEEKGTVMAFLRKKMPDFQRVLPNHIDPSRFLGVVLNELRKNPKLVECTTPSLLGALVNCAQTGLMPGPLGHAALIPRKNKGVLEVSFEPMYKGLVKLVRNSGELATIYADVVCENDEFEFQYGTDPELNHTPKLKDRGEKIAAYASAVLKDGSKQFVVLSPDEIEKIRNVSKAKVEPGKPWHDWEDEMWKKSALKRLTKLLPMEEEIAMKIAQDQTIKNVLPENFGKDIDIFELPDETVWSGDKTKQQIAETPPGEHGETGQGAPQLGPNANKLITLIMSRCNGDHETAMDMLAAFTVIEDPETGDILPGIRNVSQLTEEMAISVLPKVLPSSKNEGALFGKK